MYARNVSFRLKPNMQSEYTRTFENQILPLLRKQKGFKDEFAFSNPSSQDAVVISLWENKANADDYNTNTYPQVLKTLTNLIDGTPQVRTYETVTSTFHNVPVAV
jgi:quinol monooxygenase YgiN